MKKTILLFILLPFLFSARGSDTLSIRQIYNFDVGDTFDYCVREFNPPYSGLSISFYNVVIANKWLSANQDTIFYSRRSNNFYDTLIIANLDSTLPRNDTPSSCHCYLQFTIDSACGTIRNRFFWGNGLLYYDYAYIDGLGKVEGNNGGDSGGGIDTTLNYYVKSGVYHTTPYFTTAVDNIENDNPIRLYPNPSTDLLHLSYIDASQYLATLILTDLLGQQVYSASIGGSETVQDISKLPAGIYTWRLCNENATIKTGKIIKQ